MTEKRLYNGLDIVKLGLALLVAARHMIQIFYPPESKWRLPVQSGSSGIFHNRRIFSVSKSRPGTAGKQPKGGVSILWADFEIVYFVVSSLSSLGLP